MRAWVSTYGYEALKAYAEYSHMRRGRRRPVRPTWATLNRRAHPDLFCRGAASYITGDLFLRNDAP